MEGLEISELPLHEYQKDNDSFRLDSEFSKKDDLKIIRLLQSKGAEKFGDMNPTIIHPHEIVRAYVEEGGAWFFRAQNLRPMAIDETDKVFISALDADTLRRNRIENGDVVITRTGANAGQCALFNSTEPAIASSHTFIVRSESWSHPYLVAFLNSIYGQSQILRARYGGAQPEVAPYYLRGIWIPRFGSEFERQIAKSFTKAQQKQHESQIRYKEAEQALLKALGLENWQPPEPLTYTRRASEALAAERIDAEHFRPKFLALTTKMEAHGKVVRLGDYLRFCERGRQPDYAEEGLRVINSRHVRTNNVVIDEENRYGIEDPVQLKLPHEDRLTIRQGDLLINGTGVGTMGRSAPYMLLENALPDNHVTILRPKDTEELVPIFLSVQLNSLIGQMQVEQYFKGSSGQIELYPSEIKEFRIWLAPVAIQKRISQHIQSAHAARQEAQDLLERAKRAVEIAIEEGEPAALKFLGNS